MTDIELVDEFLYCNRRLARLLRTNEHPKIIAAERRIIPLPEARNEVVTETGSRYRNPPPCRAHNKKRLRPRDSSPLTW